MDRESYTIYENTIYEEVYKIFISSEYTRKLFRKSFMSYIKMSTDYKRYTMDIEFIKRDRSTIDAYYLTLRKNCKSTYRKRILTINRNVLINTGVVDYTNTKNTGINVYYNLDEFCKIFLREYKLIELLHGK